jgi:formylglycine-generating enzyme required for sulfatase activity
MQIRRAETTLERSPAAFHACAMLRHVAVVGLVAFPAHAELLPGRGIPQCPSGMIGIPTGTFQMGSTKATAEELPVHAVTISAFCLDRTEVTLAAYRRCVASGACAENSPTVHWPAIEDVDRDFWSTRCHGTRTDRDNHPVNCIDWDMARAYCTWAGKRLPTEAEWEYAARGTDGRTYPWGNDKPTPDHENACGTECATNDGYNTTPTFGASDGFVATAPVGTFPRGASAFGLLDMGGNVWEWVEDWYQPYAAGAVKNPQSPANGVGRVLRGGGYSGDTTDDHTMAVKRSQMEPSFRSSSGGVRCARGG